MRLAITTPASLPATQFGGILFLGVHIAKKLSEQGHKVTIYTTDLDAANDAKTFNKRLSKVEKIDNFIIKRSHVWFSKYLFFINPRMYWQMKNDDIDIIHAIGIRSFQAFIAALVSKKNNIPLVLSDQGGLTTHPEQKEGKWLKKILIKLQLPLVKYIINQATSIIVANEYEKNIFLEFSDESKIKIVKNGIDIEELKNSEILFKKKYKITEKFILFLGRFDKVKGLDTLLYAIGQIKDELSNVKFVIMGADFGFEPEMLKIIKNLKIEKLIEIIRKPPREDVISAYHECEFLVLPSRWELSPLTPLEGFACKKTVISTTAHGIPHTLTNNENALLVEPSNTEQTGKAIIKLLNNLDFRKKLEESAYKLVIDTCNSDKMVEKIFLIYKEILQKKRE